MARVNVSISDDLLAASRTAGINVSECTRRALTAELARRAKVAQLDRYLEQLDAELGPVTPQEEADAAAWADRLFGPVPGRRRTA